MPWLVPLLLGTLLPSVLRFVAAILAPVPHCALVSIIKPRLLAGFVLGRSHYFYNRSRPVAPVLVAPSTSILETPSLLAVINLEGRMTVR